MSDELSLTAKLGLELTDDLLDALAERVADRLAERDEPRYLDAKQAAAFLACNRDRIYALTSTGRIPHHKDGSRLLFDPAELRDYVLRGGAKRP